MHTNRLPTLPSPCRWLAAALLVGLVAAPGLQAQSAAREWNELLLESIRNDKARPTVHARNLYHTSIAMWDAWATYDFVAEPVLFAEDHATLDPDVDLFRSEAISHAAYQVLKVRFANSPGAGVMLPQYYQHMLDMGYDPDNNSLVGNTPAAIGNRIGATVLAYGAGDQSNEANDYVNIHYAPVNEPLLPDLTGNPLITDPNRWQPLALEFFIDQSGIIIGEYPEFLSPEWGQVSPFSLTRDDLSIYERDGYNYWVYHDPGPPPYHGTPTEEYYKWGNELVAIWSAHLDASDGVMIDASPNAIGNATLPATIADYPDFYNLFLGGDNSAGYDVNPVTRLPYPQQIVPRGDYGRILAEFWADGPHSETPPGHWFTILNYVSDELVEKRIGGAGPIISDLEWDVKAYLALAGGMHDVAISAWGIKGYYDYIRPVSAIRYMADQGQASDPLAANYNPAGIRLYPRFIELVTPATTVPGGKHAHLAGYEGEIALYAWRGPDYINDPDTDVAGVGWILAGDWWPYQRPSFVTPPFAGYVSGHSTYSRAAANIMELLTGSPYFPGGMGVFPCPQNEYLVFEDGPSMNVELQWASYVDASDQCSLSRIWGGIHPPADDIPGRKIGQVIGPEAFMRAKQFWNGTITWKDVGGGTAGSSTLGAPRLAMDGPLTANTQVQLDLLQGPPSALGFVFISFVSTPAPFLGGTLFTLPVGEVAVVGTDGAGGLSGSANFPGAATGTELWFQVGMVDANVPVYGASLSNAVKGTVP